MENSYNYKQNKFVKQYNNNIFILIWKVYLNSNNNKAILQ